jgi:hypothetical protein
MATKQQQPVGKTPTVALQPAATIHTHAPGKTIAQAISNVDAHVAAVNDAARN